MIENFFKVMPSCLISMDLVQFQHRGSVTLAQLGSAAARAIVIPPITTIKEMKRNLQCLNFTRKVEPVDVEAGDTLSSMLPLPARVNTVPFPVTIV